MAGTTVFYFIQFDWFYVFTQVLTTDVCVPISKLPEVITRVKEDIHKSSIQGINDR